MQLTKFTSSLAVFGQKLNNYHFNYSGIEFWSIHKLTETLYKEINELYDQFSEKIKMQYQNAPGSFAEHLANSLIAEETNKEFTINHVCRTIEKNLLTLIEACQKIKTSPTIAPLQDEFYLLADKFRWIFGAMKRD